jgi:aldehyde dehydrogenase (NAD+)
MAITSDITDLLQPGLLIGGRWLTDATGGAYEHVNPATGRAQADVPLAGEAEVDQAARAAYAALREWKAWRPEERRRVLTKVADLMRTTYAGELAQVSARETGTPVAIASQIAAGGADWTDYAASWADKLAGEVVPDGPGVLDYTRAEPVGVAAVVLTWNAPIGTIGMSAASALAAGCTVIIKPSELAPFSSGLWGRICRDAGIPDGVVNVLAGGPEAGAALVSHPLVDKVSFTGGGATGARIAEACGRHLKPAVLELGGKSANIVFDDADIDRAVTTASSIFMLAGQGCALPTRLLVHRAVHDQVLDTLQAKLEAVRVGDPLDPAVMMGPVITEAACDRIMGMINRARATSRLRLGGQRLGGSLADGFFVGITVLDDVDPNSEIAQDEVFGPVLTVTSFDTDDEAIALANGTDYGLAAFVHTRDLSRAHRLAAELEAGSVGVNGAMAPSSPAAPFGGFKRSGYGTQGGLGGVREFLRAKNVRIAL